jgi:hypothetical protein
MNLAWAEHEGGGQYRYGAGQETVGRFRFEPPLGVFPETEARWRVIDPVVTAGLAVREHWRCYQELPDRVAGRPSSSGGRHRPTQGFDGLSVLLCSQLVSTCSRLSLPYAGMCLGDR